MMFDLTLSILYVIIIYVFVVIMLVMWNNERV